VVDCRQADLSEFRMPPQVAFVCRSAVCRRQVEIEIPASNGTGRGLKSVRQLPRGDEESLFEASRSETLRSRGHSVARRQLVHPKGQEA
jgi:hypothetical protein